MAGTGSAPAGADTAGNDVAALRAALDRQPDDAAARLALARALLRTGDAAGALPHLRQLHREQPPSLNHWVPLVEAMLATGDANGARRMLGVMQRSGATGPGIEALERSLRRVDDTPIGVGHRVRPIIMQGLAADCRQPAILLRLAVKCPPGLRPPELAAALAAALDLDLGPPPEDDPGAGVVRVLLRMVVALQQEAALPAFDEGVVQPRPGGVDFMALVPYGDEAATPVAIDWAINILSGLLTTGPDADSWAPLLPPVAARARKLLVRLKSAASPTGNAMNFLRAAHHMGVPWRRFGAHAYQLGNGIHGRWLDSSLTDRTPALGVRLAQDKMVTGQILRRAGVPVPAHRQATTIEGALAVAKDLGYPVVVKPVDLDGGAGVAAGLEDEAALRGAFAHAMTMGNAVLVEKHVDGDDYRLVVMDGRVTWAIERVPGGVRGDGVRTLGDLLAELNADPRRGSSKRASLLHVDWDEEAAHLAAREGLTADSVPAAGRFVRLRRITNVARGGMPVPFPLDRIHPDNLRLAERAAAVLRLDLAGIDFITPDIARPWHAAGGAINEVNARPSLGLITAGHLFPEIIGWLLRGGDGRIPIVAVVGGEDGFAADLARRIHAEMGGRGLNAGLAIGAGAWIGARQVAWSDMRGEVGGALVLTDPDAAAAVLQLPLAGLASAGVPFDRCDVVVRLGRGGPPDPFEAGLLLRATRAIVGSPAALAGLAVPATRIAVAGQDAAGLVEGFAAAVARGLALDPVGSPP